MGEKWIHSTGKGTEWKQFDLKIALCFPDSYGIGMSNLGFLWVYSLLNRYEGVRCDRFFIDNRQLNRRTGPVAVETGRPLGEYDVIAFSIPYEGGYAAVPAALMAAGLEPLAAKRNRGPVVTAGGMAVSANPEPIADFLDVAFIGEAECILGDFVNAMTETKRQGKGERIRKEAAANSLREKPGCYIPGDYEPEYGKDGILEGIGVRNGSPAVVESVHLEEIREAACSPVITEDTAFPGMFLAEASRGCPYRCRFCMAGHTSHKFRECGGLVEAVDAGTEVANRVGFIGTAFTKSSALREAGALAVRKGARVSFSSVRMDRRTLEMLKEIGPGLDIETVAAAPEVASSGLAAVVGKDIFSELAGFVDSNPIPGLKKLRLYFLAGVPGETKSDIEAMADLAAEIHGKSGWEIMLSVTPMIPKAFTPMQWAAMAGEDDLRNKKRILKKAVKEIPGVTLKVEGIKEARKQAVLSRGDRRIGKALLKAAAKKKADWKEILEESGIKTEFYTERTREEKEVFPWDAISHGIEREKLYGEYEKAMKAAEKNLSKDE